LLTLRARLSAAHVAVVGLTGVTSEARRAAASPVCRSQASPQLCKNIVLAGVGKLTLYDDTPCGALAGGSFLVAHDAGAVRRAAPVPAAPAAHASAAWRRPPPPR